MDGWVHFTGLRSTTYYCFLLTGLATHHCRLPVYCLLTAAMVDANTIIDSKPSGVAIMQNVAGKLSQIAINPQNLQEFYPAIFPLYHIYMTATQQWSDLTSLESMLVLHIMLAYTHRHFNIEHVICMPRVEI